MRNSLKSTVCPLNMDAGTTKAIYRKFINQVGEALASKDEPKHSMEVAANEMPKYKGKQYINNINTCGNILKSK